CRNPRRSTTATQPWRRSRSSSPWAIASRSSPHVEKPGLCAKPGFDLRRFHWGKARGGGRIPPPIVHTDDVLGLVARRSSSMKIVGINDMSGQQLQEELERGAKFVIYEYCISLILITFKRPSDIYFIRAGESAVTRGLGFSVLSLFLGWWGIPFGP